jgi:hypothetical protein
MSNPYENQPSKAFWSRSVSKNFNPIELIDLEEPLLKSDDLVTSAGSCFASNLIPYLDAAGIQYIRTEELPKIFEQMGQNLGYANFSAAYGNVYTARQLRQLYERALGVFKPTDYFEISGSSVIDLLRPGLRFKSESLEELEFVTSNHLLRTRIAFESANVFVFTLGLTEAWISKVDGTTYPSCPGTIAGSYDSKKYEFKNFTLSEIIEDTSSFIETLSGNNSNIRFILTVSPVPLVATATKEHVLVASTHSKSVLRAAAKELVSNLSNVRYFPAYEIITGPQAPRDFFENDKRNVSKLGIESVMNTLIAGSKLSQIAETTLKPKDNTYQIRQLSEKISTVDCDEVMVDPTLY